jgi:hypothetical protein
MISIPEEPPPPRRIALLRFEAGERLSPSSSRTRITSRPVLPHGCLTLHSLSPAYPSPFHSLSSTTPPAHRQPRNSRPSPHVEENGPPTTGSRLFSQVKVPCHHLFLRPSSPINMCISHFPGTFFQECESMVGGDRGVEKLVQRQGGEDQL